MAVRAPARFVNPTPFGINQGIEYLFMAVVGGAGSVWRPWSAPTVITLLKQLLQDWLPHLWAAPEISKWWCSGILMILLLQRTRDGVWPWLARALPQRAPAPLAKAARLPETGVPNEVPLLVIESARKEFGGLVAVSDLSFELDQRRDPGLIGPNGAGKSTMFNLISGALPLTAGTIAFEGLSTGGRQPYQIARLGICGTFSTSSWSRPCRCSTTSLSALICAEAPV
jgi:branched-chain amino acid transport system permease protein